jgi:hypothetical protein
MEGEINAAHPHTANLSDGIFNELGTTKSMNNKIRYDADQAQSIKISEMEGILWILGNLPLTKHEKNYLVFCQLSHDCYNLNYR